MKNRFFIYFSLILVLLVVCYEIWPLPFWYFSRKVILPAAQVSTDSLTALVSPFSVLTKFNSLQKNNKNLETQNTEPKARLAKLNEQIYICSALSKEIKTSAALNVLSTAKVVGRSAGGDTQILIVDKGNDASVREGAAVLASGYFVGKVIKVFGDQSEVRLVASHLSLVPAILKTSRGTGLLQGGLEGLNLVEVPASIKVAPADIVLTSGLGGDLPAGLVVGETYPVVEAKKGTFQSIKVSSPINFSSIEFVSILK